MFCAANRTLRRHRRHLAVAAVMLGLAGAVVIAHSALGADHMDDGVAMCLAVVETAVVAVGTAVLAAFALGHRPLSLVPATAVPTQSYTPPPRAASARAGPPSLQVFRL